MELGWTMDPHRSTPTKGDAVSDKVKVKVKVKTEVTGVTVELSIEEASLITALLGRVNWAGNVRPSTELYYALDKALGHSRIAYDVKALSGPNTLTVNHEVVEG